MPSPSRSPSLALGAAVLVVVAVAVLGHVDAAVVDVGDAVVVVVRVGAAVLVLEAVEVLRVVRALVDVVLDAVAVAVADGRLEDEAEEAALVGGLEARPCSATPPPSIRYEFRSTKSLMPPTASF